MTAPTALRFFERQARVYRHTWRGSVVSTFMQPVFYLLAMGLGLGSLVDRQGGPEGLPYLVWLAPGLLAAAAMQTGAGEGAWPVMAGFRWVKFYQAALATPLGVRDIVWGHFAWVAVRLLMVALLYSAVIWGFGAVSVAGGLAAVVPAVVTGLAFAGPVTAYTAGLENETGLSSLFRFGIVPLFLFSGTFFPVSQLPAWIRPLAALTPLWHGVELTRWAALGLPTALSPLVHLGVLIALFFAGAVLSVRRLSRRLVV